MVNFIMSKLLSCLTNALLKATNQLNIDKPHIKKYHETRLLYEQVINCMHDYFKQHEDTYLNMFYNLLDDEYAVNFNFDDDLDYKVFMDILIYPYAANCLCTRFLNKHLVKTKDEIRMIKAMKSSTLGLYKIIECDFDDWFITLVDVLTNKKVTIIDQRLALFHKNTPEILAVMRIITYEDISFQTGLCLPFDKDDEIFRKWMEQNPSPQCPLHTLIDLHKIYKENLDTGRGYIVRT